MVRIVDIGANLLDDMFKGIYNGRQCHPPDLMSVLGRATVAGISDILVTAGSVDEAEQAQQLIAHINEHKTFNINLYTTVGIHPTRATETLSKQADYYERLLTLSSSPHVVAIGECGLDYFRPHSTPQDQISVFERHFQLAKATGKPMFLHLRDAFEDFYRLVKENRHTFTTGVVHSFDGTVEQALQLVRLSLFIGINGCSVRLARGMEVIKAVPMEWLLVESDAPWCEMRPTHASHQFIIPTRHLKKDKDKWTEEAWVKGRNEPAACRDLIELIARLKGETVERTADIIYENTKRIFSISSL